MALPISTLQTHASHTVQSQALHIPKAAASKDTADFQSIIDKIRTGITEVVSSNMQQQLNTIQQSLLNAKSITPRDLLRYQIASQQIGLRLELISKAADSALTTVRKLQNNQ